MTKRRPAMAAKPRLETLEGRLALSTSPHSIHVLAKAPVEHQKAPAIPNPILANLTPDNTGIAVTDVTYNAKLHLIEIKGSVAVVPAIAQPYYYYEPSYPYSLGISVTATQTSNRPPTVTGTQNISETITDGTVAAVSFRLGILASNGAFKSGTAVLSLNVFNPEYYYSSNTSQLIVHMRNGNAY